MVKFRVYYVLTSPRGETFPRSDVVSAVNPDIARSKVRNTYSDRLESGWSIRWTKCKKVQG